MTPHFKASELACKCGCGMLPKQDFMDKVEGLRLRYGMPLTVSSAARCPTYNAKVSGTGMTGPHTTGRAIDFALRGVEALQLLRVALDSGFSGFGINQKGGARFIHVDDLNNRPGQPRPWLWSYP
jgi:zinc D-Ala-D-Ala carboxypeptidase